jgi:hypothetical protein
MRTLIFCVLSLFFAIWGVTHFGSQIYSDYNGGPWREDPALRLEAWTSPPCTRVNFTFSHCSFRYRDAAGMHDLNYAVFGTFIDQDADLTLVRSERSPDLVTMRRALEVLPGRILFFALSELMMAGISLSILLVALASALKPDGDSGRSAPSRGASPPPASNVATVSGAAPTFGRRRS